MIEIPLGKQRHFGLKVFTWGVYLQIRRGAHWHHLTIKAFREWTFGQTGFRRGIWIGWWSTQRGERGSASGYRLSVERVRGHRPGPRNKKLRQWYPSDRATR